MRLKMPIKPIPYVRMVIIKDGRAKKGDKVIALEETTLKECYDYFNGLIQHHLKLWNYKTQDLVTIELRDYLGTKGGKSKQFSFRGFTTKQVEELILNNIK